MMSTEQERAMAKLHAQAAQWEEYEDEYDDSFDDLAGFDADANADTQSELSKANRHFGTYRTPKSS